MAMEWDTGMLAFDALGQGPVVLLLHGFPLCRGMWQPQVAVLTAAGYRVLVPDLPGFGASSAGAVPQSLDGFADSVVALLDRLQIERAIIGGMSMGGYVLLNLLERHGQRVAAGVFIVTRSGADDEAGKARRSEMIEAVTAGRQEVVTTQFAEILLAEESLRRRPELLGKVKDLLASASAAGLVGALRAMRERKDYTPLLPDLQLPSLVIGAEQDRAVPPMQARLLAEALPLARLCLIPKAGHLVNLEQPEAFNRCLLEFLQELPPG